MNIIRDVYIKRFPDDFLIRLTKKEKDELVAKCDRFSSLKHSSMNPYAFTEQGVSMLSSVLNSDRAIEVNITIMRVFVNLRRYLSSHKDLINKVVSLEKRVDKHDEQIMLIFKAIKSMISEPAKQKPKIGFHRD